MKIGIGLLLASVLTAGFTRSEGATLFDIDFGAATRQVDSKGNGSLQGVLPVGVNDNFSSWSTGHVVTEIKEEGGRRFLRFTTPLGSTGGQFVIGGIEPPFPGCFRLTVKSRVVADRPLSMGFRLTGSPYTTFSDHSFGSPEWQEESLFFEVRQPRSGSVGFYFYTWAGTTDIERIKLEAVTEDELAASIVRPSKSQTDFIRHMRFPLGLPCGWNFGRECVDAICEADRRECAPDGVPVLKVSSEKSWDIWGEAFQTGHPEAPHTLRFMYRSEAPAKVEVVDDSGRRAGELQLAASKDWREARLVFKPMKLSTSFGLHFVGKKGPFWLDKVRVYLGEGAAPRLPYPVQVTLAVNEGEVASETRIQFVDEVPRLKLNVRGLPTDAQVRVKVADLYGREKDLATFNAAACASGTVDFVNTAFNDAPVGQFRVTAWAEKRDGRRLSLDEELVVTRLPRPIAWGRDAPDSPFGCHFNPNRATVRLMKAGGVNWARLHDAGSNVSGWFAQEPKKGEWNFHDKEVAIYRDANIKIFAQLGTAPAWATHFGDLGYKWMGYFEKYLRPTNSVDWVNYVTKYVKHHEKNIDEYFVWNEPWGAWWERAADIKWYDAKKAGEDFAAFTRLTYDAVKKVNPKIRVSGFNSTSGELGQRWSRDVFVGGGFEACDIIDWHYYTPDPRGLQSDEDVTAKPLAPIRAKYPDLGGKPVYMSEGQGTSTGGGGQVGRMSGLLKVSVPWPQEDLAHAALLGDKTCRYILSLLAEGNSKIFLYTAHSSEGLAKMPRFQVLLGADGFAHPALVAHAQLAQAIEGRRFVRKENVGEKGVKYIFSGRGGEIAIYSCLTANEVRELMKTTRLKDLYGNRVTSKTLIPDTLVYAEPPSSLEFTGKGFVGKNGELSVATVYENGKTVVKGLKFRDGGGYNALFWGGSDPMGKWCAAGQVRDQVMTVDPDNESVVVRGVFKKGEKNPELPFYQRISRTEDGRRVRLEIQLGDETTPARDFSLSLVGFLEGRQLGDARERYIVVNGKRVDLSWVEEKEREKRQFAYWSKDVKKGDDIALDLAADRSILGFVPVECPHICFISLWDKSRENYDKTHMGFAFTPDARLVLEFDFDRTPSQSTKGYIVRGVDFAPAGFRMPDYTRSRNLLLNGSFEEGLYFWQVDSWGRQVAQDNPHPFDFAYQVVEGDAVDGRRALRWRVYPGTGMHLSTYGLPVTPRQTYTLSFWAKTDLPGTPNLFLSGWSQAYGPHIEEGRYGALTREWKRYTKTFTAPNRFFRLTLVPMDVTTEGHIWLDKVQLIEGEDTGDVAVGDPGFVLETAHEMNWCQPGERLGARVRFQSATGGKARIHWNAKDIFRRVVRTGEGEEDIPAGHIPTFFDMPALEGLDSGTYAVEMTVEGFGAPTTRYFRFTLMPKLSHDFKHRFLFNATLFSGAITETMTRFLPFWADAGIGSVVAFWPPDKALYDQFLKPLNIVPCGCAFDSRIDRRYDISNYYGKYNLVRTAPNGLPSVPDSERELFVKQAEDVARRYPYVKWWKTINEPLYSDEDNRHAARVLRWTAEGLRRGNPDAIVLTPDPGALDENVRKIWDAGAKEFCDYPAVHPYREHPEDPDLDANIQTLREWFPGRKVLFTEGNYFTCLELPANSCTAIGHGKALGSGDSNRLGQMTSDIGIGELAGTAHAMRYRLQTLKNADFVLMDNDWGCSDGPEAFIGVDMIPSARIFAVNTLGKLLGNADFVSDILFGEPIRCYLFEDEMKRPVAVIWNYHKEIFRNPQLVSSLDWKGMSEKAEVFNLVGARETVPADGLLPVTGAPLFIRGEVGRTAEFKKALEALDMVGGEVPDFRVEKFVEGGQLKVSLVNIRAREVKGHLKFVADGKVVTEEDVVLSPQGKHIVALPLVGQYERKKHSLAFVFEAVGKEKMVKEFALDGFCIKEMPRGTKADGDLTKWADAPAIRLPTFRDLQPPSKSKWFNAPLFRKGDADFSAAIKAKWNSDGLYLLVDVTDDVYAPFKGDNVAQSYLGDGIQLYIDTFGDGVNATRDQYDPDDQVYQLRCRDGKTIECWREREPWKQYAFTKQGLEPRIGGTFTRTETGWRMDLKLPLEALPPMILEKGRAVGLSVLVNDNDGDYRKRACYLSEGSEPMGRPNTWPLMILE